MALTAGDFHISDLLVAPDLRTGAQAAAEMTGIGSSRSVPQEHHFIVSAGAASTSAYGYTAYGSSISESWPGNVMTTMTIMMVYTSDRG